MTGTEIAILVAAFLTGIAGLITSTVNSRASATKTQFDALKDMIVSLKSMVDSGIDEIERLKERLKEMARENDELRSEIKQLERNSREKDGSIAHLKVWAEMLVHTLQKNGIDVPPMPDKQNTKPRK